MISGIKSLYHGAIRYTSTRTVSDEYIDWLTLANAGMLSKGNIYAMRFAIQHLPSTSPVVEIGSFCGLSTNVISYLLATQEKENKIITCDKWMFEGAEGLGQVGNSQIPHGQYRDYVKAAYMNNVDFFSKGNKPYTIEEFSDDFFESWKNDELRVDVFEREIQLGGKISFCYIDGNHTYDFAKRDFENVSQHLDVGGCILFDDSFDMTPFGLTALMKEIMKDERYVLVMRNPNYMFKKII